MRSVAASKRHGDHHVQSPLPPFGFILLHVDQPRSSAVFYEKLLGAPALELSDTFAMFPLGSGVMLGLWSRHTVEPATAGGPGAAELAWPLADDDAVRSTCEHWRTLGVTIAQEPTPLDFGLTCVGLDPDGHRLRVFHPA